MFMEKDGTSELYETCRYQQAYILDSMKSYIWKGICDLIITYFLPNVRCYLCNEEKCVWKILCCIVDC